MTIDWWTLGFQTVNIVILIWLLQRFFWKPVAAMIAERRVAAQKALADAEAARDKAKLDLIDIDKTRVGFAAEREKILAEARVGAEQASAAKLAEADLQAAALVAAAKAGVANDEVAATRAWATRSSNLAVDIAKRLAARLDGAAVHGVFLDWALKAIRALPAATREAATGSPVALETTSATPLDPAEQVKVIQMIGEAFGAPVRVVFKSDPTLIAGLELRTDHLVVANSWRADLVQILAGLAHDK
jgi:F-type H+-transporting ATPase subunit b